MPEFIDIEQITLRGGPETHKFGDPYICSGQGKIEHDRYIYLYNIVGDYKDIRSALRKVSILGKEYGWKGIRWERIRIDGTIHIVEFKI
jgi:hypothetical protein